MINKLIKSLFYVFITLSFNQCMALEVFAEESHSTLENLAVIDNKVTLNAKDISLKDVLLSVCDKAGIRLFLDGQFPNKVNISVDNQPIEQLFRKLLVNTNFIMIYSEDKPLVKKVLVYESFNNSANLIASSKQATAEDIKEELEWIHYLSTRPEDEAISGLSEVISRKEAHLESKLFAIEQLSTLAHNKAVVNVMAEGLADGRSEIRERVVQELGQLEHPVAHQILGQVIFGEKEPHLRMQAVKQLAVIHTPVSAAFIKAATNDKNSAVQAEAEFVAASQLK